MQTFTSSATSINRSKLPAVYGKADLRHPLVFDYGCGKYTDHIEERIRSMHKTYLPYDPYNKTDDVNKFSVTLVINAMHVHYPVDVICSNVLNVIDDDDTVRKIARHIAEIVEATGGTGHVTVYEADRSGVGRQTGADQYQRNEPLRSYLKYFPTGVIRNGMIIISKEATV